MRRKNNYEKHMKTKLRKIISFGLCLAAALALVAGTATKALADEAKTAKGGASELLKLKPIKTAEDIAALKESDSVVMSCPKCKTVTIIRITKENKPGKTSTVPTSEHLCPGCDNKVTVTGHGKAKKDVITHVCSNCGSKDAFCCVLKADSGPIKGMAKDAR
jgi:predicted RNA-binding Zn-ribbon protein involved in translation (DUF1610 family)